MRPRTPPNYQDTGRMTSLFNLQTGSSSPGDQSAAEALAVTMSTMQDGFIHFDVPTNLL